MGSSTYKITPEKKKGKDCENIHDGQSERRYPQQTSAVVRDSVNRGWQVFVVLNNVEQMEEVEIAMFERSSDLVVGGR